MRTPLLLAAIVLLSACSDITGVEPTTATITAEQVAAKKETAAGQQTQNLVEIAVGNEAFSILVQAVTRVGLAGALQADDQFTVFAPTNDAFVSLLGELGASSLDDIDDATLTAVLLYHVVPGRRFSNSVLRAKKLSTLNGGFIMVNRGTTTLTDANGRDVNIVVPLFDIPASNGVIHVIDRVLLP